MMATHKLKLTQENYTWFWQQTVTINNVHAATLCPLHQEEQYAPKVYRNTVYGTTRRSNHTTPRHATRCLAAAMEWRKPQRATTMSPDCVRRGLGWEISLKLYNGESARAENQVRQRECDRCILYTIYCVVRSIEVGRFAVAHFN